MSADSVLDEAFTRLLGKVQQEAAQQQVAAAVRPATINFVWGGGGLPIVAANCDPLLVEVPFPSFVVWAHLYAGDALGHPVEVTATVEVRLTQLLTFGDSVPLYGLGLPPHMTVAAVADVNVQAWQQNLITGDALVARLATFSGTATWLALVLQLRPTDVPLGVTGIVDDSGDTIVDSDGNPIVLRS